MSIITNFFAIMIYMTADFLKKLSFLLFTASICFATNAMAQNVYRLSGSVVDENNKPIVGATIFISRSEHIGPTDEEGRFAFNDVAPGTYQLSALMMGYYPLVQNIVINNGPLVVEMKMKVKLVQLAQVDIGKDDWKKKFQLFKQNFLGTSLNANDCVIRNPQALNFTTRDGILLAESDDFLIIDNKRLGYRIRYMLQDFGYNLTEDIALYHGEYSFEELTGTAEDKKRWIINRSKVYQGSFMHFLRAVSNNRVKENGFMVREFYGFGSMGDPGNTMDKYRVVIDDRLVAFDSVRIAADSTFTTLKFKMFYIIFDPKKVAHYPKKISAGLKIKMVDDKASVLKLSSKTAIIDKKGGYMDYRDFFIHGFWAKARVGDQLPLEYRP